MQSKCLRTAAAALVVVAGASLSSCGGTGFLNTGSSSKSIAPSPTPFAGVLTYNFASASKTVDVSTQVKVTAAQATLSSVALTSAKGPVSGVLATSGASWSASGLLSPDTPYTLKVDAVDSAGNRTTQTRQFTTRKLTRNQQTYPTFVPSNGATVGIAMPVVIRFDVPVTNHAAIEKHLKVTSSPVQAGGWRWVSDNEVHWRPATYWKPGTRVTVEANIGGVPAAKGVWGQLDRKSSFTVGRAQIIKVNIQSHQASVYREGRLLRTLPVTTGQQPEYTTRSGIKVIMEQYRYINMNSETVGIDPDSSQGYNLKDVEYAMRLTNSGEFIHAAPWSVGSQGVANVSHGCTGMSTANAGWLFNNTMVGDPVEYTGSSRMMTPDNGFGDWNLPASAFDSP